MKRAWLMVLITVVLGMASGTVLVARQPVSGSQDAVATFRSNVDLVRVNAVVRTKNGRFVQDLTARDFEILEGGRQRPITSFQRDAAGISVALLLDVSGSMRVQLPHAREAANQMLSRLESPRDEAAVYAFDTRVQEVAPFTRGLRQLPDTLAHLTPFGATSLHDAIAQTARRAGTREGRRRAVVVVTDGLDNASRLTPATVSRLASALDVPVYVVGVVSAIDNPSAAVSTVTGERSPFTGALADLSMQTGGNSFVVSTSAEQGLAARQIVEELRHQYLIAFQSSREPGWHPIVVRAHDKDLRVRARRGYYAGESRPTEP